ncbi:MAG: metalloregulator ArsR/SmtB family transcription factor [Porticoccaceae bacterium]|jgi:DNA-binding transcriptional ArsR family regulator
MSTPLTTDDLEQLAEHAQEASALLKQLSNQHRLMILCSLIDGELSVTELNNRTNLSQSALSQHLASLRSAELVQTRREAQTIFYQLQGNEAIQVIKVLKSIYCP